MNWLVTGAAGFIGTNLCIRLLKAGESVTAIDDLSRKGSEKNAAHLATEFGLRVNRIDISRTDTVVEFLQKIAHPHVIAHLAGQVSFMSSISNPRRDFEINALGTLNLLEFVRVISPETVLIAMSSNKIYGDLAHVRFNEGPTRYVAPDWPNGFDESVPIQFHGPYGCSKGAVDQYVADYGRIYGLKVASFRQSSVYGPFQHPLSDQGWVGYLVSEALSRSSIKLNGVGKQVRDLLHVDDLATLFLRLPHCISQSSYQQFNVGGGMSNALSILELFDWLEPRIGHKVEFECGQVRPSDQKVFVADNSRISELTGWHPSITLDEGLKELIEV